MPGMSTARKMLTKLGGRHTGFPIATIAYYGPTDKFATKVAVGIADKTNKVVDLECWFSTTLDIRLDDEVCQQIVTFMERHRVQRAAITDRIIGCHMRKGPIIPKVKSAPSAPFGQSGTWTGKTIN